MDDNFRGLLPRFCYFVITSCSYSVAGGKPIRKIQDDRAMIFSKGILSTHADIVGLVYRLKCRREFWVMYPVIYLLKTSGAGRLGLFSNFPAFSPLWLNNDSLKKHHYPCG